MVSTLFEKLGGEDAVDKVVESFYAKVLADDRVKHFFAQTDMEKQKKHQKSFMAFAFGGSVEWNGKSMREAHKHLVEKMGLNDQHFDAIAENLVITLREFNIPEETIAEIASIVASDEMRKEVLNR